MIHTNGRCTRISIHGTSYRGGVTTAMLSIHSATALCTSRNQQLQNEHTLFLRDPRFPCLPSPPPTPHSKLSWYPYVSVQKERQHRVSRARLPNAVLGRMRLAISPCATCQTKTPKALGDTCLVRESSGLFGLGFCRDARVFIQ